MANTTANESPLMMELASRIITQIASFFESVSVSRSYPIEEFPYEGAENYLYVLYSANGMPLHAGSVTGSTGKRDQNRVNKEIQGFGASGYVASYRVLELGSEELTRQMERLVKEMFGDALPLTTSTQISPETETTEMAPAEEVEAPVRGHRGRSKKSKATKAGRRGRPRKDVTESVDVPAPRRRGRPKKIETAAVESTASRRRGRPKKDETATVAEAPVPRRRGRPAKTEVATGAEATAPRRRGRPKKEETAAVESAAPRRRGPAKKMELEAVAPPVRQQGPKGKGKAGSKGGGRKGRKAAAGVALQASSGEGESQTS